MSHLLDRSADPPFSPALSLVGHNAPLEFAIFNPRLFPSPNGPISILATASDDGSLSFWSSASPKALFAVEGLVDAVQGVHDGCWDPSGSVFLCVTHGGFANAFEIPELGIPMGKEELDRLLDSYGYRKKGTVAESTRVLEVEQGGLVGEAEEKFGGRLGMGGMVGVASDKGKEKADVEMAEAPPASESMMSAPSVSGGFGVEAVSQAASVPAPAPPAPAPSGPVPPVPMPAPVVQRTKDGKKRIAPTFIRR